MSLPEKITRRAALQTLGVGVAALTVSQVNAGAAPAAGTTQPFTLPKLGYAYDALEPHIDARTMEIHHTKHHQAYISNANTALGSHAVLKGLTAESLVADLSKAPESIRTALRNNVGGQLNHALFWETIGPAKGGKPGAALASDLSKAFGSVEAFQTQFADAATKRFGSGWAWLVAKEGKLSVTSTANQDSPLMDGAVPLLGLDVWEHAYYLKYQNRRADYIAAFWNLVNWDRVAAKVAAVSG